MTDKTRVEYKEKAYEQSTDFSSFLQCSAVDPMPKGLYVVSVPIGNLKDMTLRGIQTLQNSDIIFCEDTRVSGRLLPHYGVNKPLQPYHEHNADKQRRKIISLIEEGKKVALISDAGTPLISDPGFKLVRELRQLDYYIRVIPGVTAAITALTGSGLPTDKFLFGGFMPHKSGARQSTLTAYATASETLIFYDTVTRVQSTLADIQETLGNRKVCIGRELTKTFEEFIAGDLGYVQKAVEAHATLKGELVLLIEGAREKSSALDEDQSQILQNFMKSRPLKEAVALTIEAVGGSKKELYAHGLELKNESNDDL